FSCFSPDWFFHWRLVARDSVATRDPLEVLRTSGSAPRVPISMTLFRLRLTSTSRIRSLGPLEWSREKYRSRTTSHQPKLRLLVPTLRMLLESQSQDQGIFFGIPVIRRALAHRSEAMAEIEGLGRVVRFSHLEKDLLDLALPQRPDAGPEERPSQSSPAKLGSHRQV